MKILKKISKKITGLLLAISMLFTNIMPITTVFALTEEEKEDLVEIRLRQATGLNVNNNVATVNYEGGSVTISGGNLTKDQDDHWDYGDGNYGTMYILFTSSSSITVHFYPDEDHGASYRLGDANPEMPENNEWVATNLLTRRNRAEGYDLEIEFPGDNGAPVPTGQEYSVNFGSASWEVNNEQVTAEINGVDITHGAVTISDDEVIRLNNFNGETMEVRVSGSDGFNVRLHVNEFLETFLADIDGDGNYPPEAELTFEVVPRGNNSPVNNSYQVDFGTANWDVGEEHVSASIGERDLIHGPIEVGLTENIHLDGFNPDTMQVMITNGDFSTKLYVDDRGDTWIDTFDKNVNLPNGTFTFSVVSGNNNHEHTIPLPSGREYDVEFGNAAWEVNDVTVTASIEGKILTEGFVTITDADIIKLTNFDPDNMLVRVYSRGGFATFLNVDEQMETFLANIQSNGALPDEDLYFEVIAGTNHQEGRFEVEFGTAEWTIGDEYVSASLEGNDVVLKDHGPIEIGEHDCIHLEGFNSDTMAVVIENEDGFMTELFVDEFGNTSIDRVDQEAHVPNDSLLYFYLVEKENGEPGPHNQPQEGNTTAIIRINGVDGTYRDIEYNEVTGEDEEVERPYDGKGAVCNEALFNINDGAIWGFLPEGEKEDDHGWFQYNEIEYPFDMEETDTTIKLGIFTEWFKRFSGVIKINDVNYKVSDYINYDNRDSWLTHAGENIVGFYINVPKAENNIYNITVQIDPDDVKYLSVFEWSLDPYDEYFRDEHGEIIYYDEQPITNPAYIANASFEILKAEFSIGEDDYEYTDFRKRFGDDFINYDIGYHDEYQLGILFVPSETTLTVRIVPKPGYQVTDIIVPGGFVATDEPGVYTFTSPLDMIDFHIETQTRQDIKTVEHNDISDASIVMNNSTIIEGNSQFAVSEVNDTVKNGFAGYANGYEIATAFNITVSQVLNKASDEFAWISPFDHLNKDANVTITLNDSLDADDIVLLRQTGEDTYEQVEMNYNKNTRTISFNGRKFGNYAIAVKNLVPVESINFTLAQPKAGVKIDVENGVPTIRPSVTVDNNANYVVTDTHYVNSLCKNGQSRCEEYFNGTFDVNGEYYAMITFEAKDGYKFLDSTVNNITVNSRAVDDDDQIYYNDDEKITIIVRIQPEQEEDIVKGDFNGDGEVGLTDVIYLLKVYLGLEPINDDNKLIGDMNNDNDINLMDVIGILKRYLGLN